MDARFATALPWTASSPSSGPSSTPRTYGRILYLLLALPLGVVGVHASS